MPPRDESQHFRSLTVCAGKSSFQVWMKKVIFVKGNKRFIFSLVEFCCLFAIRQWAAVPYVACFSRVSLQKFLRLRWPWLVLYKQWRHLTCFLQGAFLAHCWQLLSIQILPIKSHPDVTGDCAWNDREDIGGDELTAPDITVASGSTIGFSASKILLNYNHCNDNDKHNSQSLQINVPWPHQNTCPNSLFQSHWLRGVFWLGHWEHSSCFLEECYVSICRPIYHCTQPKIPDLTGSGGHNYNQIMWLWANGKKKPIVTEAN